MPVENSRLRSSDAETLMSLLRMLHKTDHQVLSHLLSTPVSKSKAAFKFVSIHG